ncbi:transcriptional regulator, TetR family [Chitinophaga jiangningensis]|uniref:Transcriptional regulator, TetR family n=1 Tax=Chitinophaga jiangningensis TaxID=1419482 RepID=A0A1M7CF62_9BACT|nr:TetR/AcrR family transcriptional regulator [Chitinophaga jiangningensis]SHL65895.1 transcriptional regulator, TetR family [Chitinophaga jiangningensis]
MSETREKIISLADKLIRVNGFNAFSYKDIAQPLEMKNAAVHYHFPGKTDLGIGVINEELYRFTQQTHKWQKLPEDEQLKHFIDVFRKHCHHGNICLMGSLSPDYNTLAPDMQLKVQEMANAILQWLSACLDAGRKHKRFKFKGSAEDRALLIITNLQASLLMSRVLGNTIFSRISHQLLDDILI